jgi:CHASE3 domain sensor protein
VERYLIKQGLKRLILLPIVLSVLYAGLLLWQLNRMVSEGDWVEHITQVMSLASDAQRHVQFQENALRGFLLTKAPLFEDQFIREDTVIDSVFQQLHQLALDNRLHRRT